MIVKNIENITIIIEIQLRVVVLTKLDKTIKPVKNIFLVNLKVLFNVIFHY